MSTTWINRGHLYAPHVTPVLADCNFIVDSANGNGLGIRSLKGQAVANVFMHTSSTPGRGTNNQLNPNPAVGYILVQLTDNYTRAYGGFSNIIAPVSGTPLTATTAGNPAIITALGTATADQWRAVGLPPGVTAAVGAVFIATASATIGGSAAVEVPATPSITSIQPVGDANLSLGPAPLGPSPNVGGWLLLECLAATTVTAPADGTTISLVQYLNQSSVLVKGE